MSPLQPTLLLRPRLAAAALARSALCDACGDGLLRLRGGGPEALPMDRRTGWAILFGATLDAAATHASWGVSDLQLFLR